MAKQTVEDLRRSIANCNGKKGCIKKSQDDFVADGGTTGTSESGKVFADQNGGKVFVTDSGKVF